MGPVTARRNRPRTPAGMTGPRAPPPPQAGPSSVRIAGLLLRGARRSPASAAFSSEAAIARSPAARSRSIASSRASVPPLLRPVMEVPLDPPPFGVPGFLAAGMPAPPPAGPCTSACSRSFAIRLDLAVPQRHGPAPAPAPAPPAAAVVDPSPAGRWPPPGTDLPAAPPSHPAIPRVQHLQQRVTQEHRPGRPAAPPATAACPAPAPGHPPRCEQAGSGPHRNTYRMLICSTLCSSHTRVREWIAGRVGRSERPHQAHQHVDAHRHPQRGQHRRRSAGDARAASAATPPPGTAATRTTARWPAKSAVRMAFGTRCTGRSRRHAGQTPAESRRHTHRECPDRADGEPLEPRPQPVEEVTMARDRPAQPPANEADHRHHRCLEIFPSCRAAATA